MVESSPMVEGERPWAGEGWSCAPRTGDGGYDQHGRVTMGKGRHRGRAAGCLLGAATGDHLPEVLPPSTTSATRCCQPPQRPNAPWRWHRRSAMSCTLVRFQECTTSGKTARNK